MDLSTSGSLTSTRYLENMEFGSRRPQSSQLSTTGRVAIMQISQALAALRGHPYTNLTIAECRFLAARLMHADLAAQEQAAAVEDHNVNEICRQILGNYGYWGWLDGLIISLLSAATCTNIVVVHCKG